MKIKGNGQAKILNPAEIKALFTELQKVPRDECFFAIMFFTGCRVSEARQLETGDINLVNNPATRNLGTITFRKGNTKGKLKTRCVPIHPALIRHLEAYQPKRGKGLMFPGRISSEPICRNTPDRILRGACKDLGIIGVSTHSFRRSALTTMHRAGVPLRVIQEISGISSLEVLQRYLEIDDEQVIEAIHVLSSW